MSNTITFLADHVSYPERLRALPSPPRSVTVEGGPLHARRVVAIVGTRRPSDDAFRFAFDLAAEIARSPGAVVASGGAAGIDTAAHTGALAARGRTWVVAPTGRKHLYPKQNAEMFDLVAGGEGAMVWPFAEETAALPGNFFMRNGVLVALADVVVVIQAAFRSGANNTAAWARKLGRPVWAVGAPPWSTGYQGCLHAIDHGARVLTSIRAFLEANDLAPPESASRSRSEPLFTEEASTSAATTPTTPTTPTTRGREGADDLAEGPFPARGIPLSTLPPPHLGDPVVSALFEACSAEPRHLDEIALRARVCASAASTGLLTLALENVLLEGPTGFYRRANER